MKLRPGVYPDFYKKRPYVLKEEAGDIFVGREIELEVMWDKLSDLLRGHRVNWSMMAQRKMGKTALMKRFYNVMFWEQNQVVPLYYCFKNRKTPIADIADEMVLSWISQWAAFITQDPKAVRFEYEKQIQNFIKKIDKKYADLMLDELAYYHEGRKTNSGKKHIRAALLVAQSLSKQFEMPCVLMIDEMQELASGVLLDEQGKGIRCEDELFEVVTNPDIWTIGAGSQVSMLAYNVVVDHLANRVRPQKFYPLKQEDSKELARKLLKHYGYKGYKGIEQDIYKLVGGNPFYIIALLSPSHHFIEQKDKNKKFESREDLREIFNFEATESGGEIFTFWERHFVTYQHKLNNDPKDKKGLSYRILRYVAENKDRKVMYSELQKEFDLTVEEVERKTKQLEYADLLRHGRSHEIMGLPDEVLSLVITCLYYPQITGEESLEGIDRAFKLHVEKKLGKIEQQVQSQQGKINNLAGADFEEKVKEAIRKGKIEALNGYKVSGRLRSILVRSGRKQYQLDIVGKLKTKNKKANGRPGLIAEVKDRKKKIGIAEARKFHEAVKIAKKQEKFTRIVALFLSTAGFTRPAQKYLGENKIHFACAEAIQ